MTLHLPRPHGRHRAIDRVRKLETAGIALTGAWADLEKAVAEIRRLQQRVIQDAVDKERLRQALHNAQPRISTVPAQAKRPTAPDSIPLRAA
ncbi:hypothetical protein ABZ553_14455 [Streptomyces sparsogenes]|uniref:hypothetical protein n=1 Tax=Streptomyces sparsogenes TaxID=67365 RepID=UPI0033C7FB61